MLRLERVGLLAAARAETGWRPEGVRVKPFVAAALGDRVWLREGEPLAEELSAAVEDLGVPGLRGDADMAFVTVWPNRRRVWCVVCWLLFLVPLYQLCDCTQSDMIVVNKKGRLWDSGEVQENGPGMVNKR